MSEKIESKMEALPDLDDLLQCPVCYEIPSGQIFQCNEGHHVCGRCKMRLDVCPVCRALFFGTRNYAMEELIANVKKLRAFKLGGKVTTGTAPAESSSPPIDEASSEAENNDDDDENQHNFASRPAFRAPQACKGLFRCLCCKHRNSERLPAARLLNHLRYFHAPDLIEGSSENGEYLQAWQFSTDPGRIVTAVRVADMGIFFLIIEMSESSVSAWLTMAASPWVAHEFCYTVTISGNDREAIFSDCVWSVRSCEGSLRKRGHCLVVNGTDARALTAPSALSGKLSIRRVPSDQLTNQTQPRAVVRVASRGNSGASARPSAPSTGVAELEPFLLDLHNDVARLSRAFVRLGREADALVRVGAHHRNEMRNQAARNTASAAANERPVPPPAPPVAPPPAVATPPAVAPPPEERAPLSRSARRRMRQRVRAALNASQPPLQRPETAPAPPAAAPLQRPATAPQRPAGPPIVFSGFAVVQPATPSPPPPTSSGPSNGEPNRNQTRASKKKRRHRR